MLELNIFSISSPIVFFFFFIPYAILNIFVALTFNFHNSWIYYLVRDYSTWPFSKRQILHPSKLKEYPDDNFKFDENGRKLSKWVENTGGNFLQGFWKTCTADM